MLNGLLILICFGVGIAVIYNIPKIFNFIYTKVTRRELKIKMFNTAKKTSQNITGVINAIVLTPFTVEERVLDDATLKSLFTGWYNYNNNNIIICQENPKKIDADGNPMLEKWQRQNAVIGPENPTRTPQQLYDLIEWESEVTGVYAKQGNFFNSVNVALFGAIIASLLLVVFLIWSGGQDAASGV